MTLIKKEEQERTKKSKELFLENFEQSLCNVSACCKRVGISRNTFYTWKKEDEDFREKCEEIEESLLDFAETMLFKKIRDGGTPELLFFLKTRGKKRGYVERQEFTGADGSEIIWKETKTYETEEKTDRGKENL
ncbi:MAG: hypothetical protein Unbinned5930contig1000_29 [Prokaryotic dsDNA virus sp.]|nr:MAG: hypothetical protein Unbinned5930contig1000_29 [Prokaryotic dsDNA virus sp.]|tara:strand:- start:151 stop:552 length:402 start_codon:yes stop_codon:yes gene_type:complete